VRVRLQAGDSEVGILATETFGASVEDFYGFRRPPIRIVTVLVNMAAYSIEGLGELVSY
jgi:hypothetical protein